MYYVDRSGNGKPLKWCKFMICYVSQFEEGSVNILKD